MSCGEYWRRTRSAAQCALSNSTLAAARSALRRAISVCFLSPETIYNSSILFWGTQEGPGNRIGRTATFAVPAGPTLRGHQFLLMLIYHTALLFRRAST